MVGKGYEHTINSKEESAFGVAGVAELAEIELRCRHGVCATTRACACTMMDARCQRGEDEGGWMMIARVDTFCDMMALYERQLQLLGDDDEPCVVSWSWQTRALRRAAGNCVLYTYTTKIYTQMGDPIRDNGIPGRALALTH